MDLPLWLRVVIVGGLALTCAVWVAHAVDEHDAGVLEQGRQGVQAAWERANAQAAAEKLAKARENAAETLRRLERQQEADHVHAEALARAAVDAAGARDAADRMQQRAAQLVDELCRTAAAGDPAALERCKAADSPAGMLADVQRRLVDRARLLATVADRARAAGELCERDYDALRVTP